MLLIEIGRLLAEYERSDDDWPVSQASVVTKGMTGGGESLARRQVPFSFTNYGETVGAVTARALEEVSDTADALGRVLADSASTFCEHGHPRGCMISIALLTSAAENEPVAAHVADLRQRTLAALQARIERGIAEGDLRADTDARALARFVGAIIQGLSVQARDGATPAELAAVAGMARAEIARYRA